MSLLTVPRRCFCCNSSLFILFPVQSTLVISTLLITAYLEVKICSLFKHGSLKTDYKLVWKRGEIAPFSSFSQYFQYISNSGVKLHIRLWNVVVLLTFLPTIEIWYVEVRISRSISESPLHFEIIRINCTVLCCHFKQVNPYTVPSPVTHNDIVTSFRRRCDVMTSQSCRNNVNTTLCVCWVGRAVLRDYAFLCVLDISIFIFSAVEFQCSNIFGTMEICSAHG